MSDLKILVVSDIHHFSVLDVYNGYIEGFKQLGVDVHGIEVHELIGKFSQPVTYNVVLSTILNKANGFTHVLFISGLAVPEWVLASKYDKKFGIIACDDPHASQATLVQRKKYFDYYFTNEKTCENREDGVFYLPTASTSKLPINVDPSNIPEHMRYDFVFVGTVYKGREKPLEEICKFCEENGHTIKIHGPLLKTKPDSIIRKYANEGIIRNQDALMLYRGARKAVINLDRDIHWNPNVSRGNPTLVKTGKKAYSPNPRVYEIAGCLTPQLYVNPRKGVKDVFGDNIYYCKNKSVVDGLKSVLEDTDENRETKVKNCFEIVKRNHLYIHRANSLLNFMKGVDSNVT